jgi:hypothetical protein
MTHYLLLSPFALSLRLCEKRSIGDAVLTKIGCSGEVHPRERWLWLLRCLVIYQKGP